MRLKNMWSVICLIQIFFHRAIADEDKGLAIGVMEVAIALFGFIPAPVIMGAIIGKMSSICSYLPICPCLSEGWLMQNLLISTYHNHANIFVLLYASDSSCVVWNTSCGKTGNCWVYDTYKLRIITHLVPAGKFCLSMFNYNIWYLTYYQVIYWLSWVILAWSSAQYLCVSSC